jgi:hypothetical protein
MNRAIQTTAHENKIRRWQTFTPPQSTTHAAHCGLVLHWRAYATGRRQLPGRSLAFLHPSSPYVLEPRELVRFTNLNFSVRKRRSFHSIAGSKELSEIPAKDFKLEGQALFGANLKLAMGLTEAE